MGWQERAIDRVDRAYARAGVKPRPKHWGIEHFVGLDLGQANDYTAQAVITKNEDRPKLRDLGKLDRYELGTSYPDIVKDVSRLIERLEAKSDYVELIVDATGVGRPVVDLFREADLSPVAVTFTAGHEVTKGESGGYNVPKRNLVSTVKVALQENRLRSSPDIPFADVLKHELLSFRAKINLKGHDTYEAWREGDHDDLVMAVALALWQSNRRTGKLEVVTLPFERSWMA